MRFSAVAVAALATQAAAWRPGRPSGSWGWGSYPGNGGAVTTTITVPAPTGGPSVPVVTPAPVAAPVQEDPAPAPAPAPTTTASSGSPGSSGLTADQKAALDAHNAARSEVGVPPLEWDDSLAADALEWAAHLLSVGSLTHSQTDGQGENLYMQSNKDSPSLNAANAWISEKADYHGEAISSTNYMGFGHYTQAVWKSTTKIGMALATNSQGTYVVARYSPPGNFIGQKPY